MEKRMLPCALVWPLGGSSSLWAVFPCWLLARGHPQFLAMWGSPTCQFSSRESASKSNFTILCALIMKVTSPPNCYILLIISKLITGRELHEAVDDRRQRTLGAILDTAYRLCACTLILCYSI